MDFAIFECQTCKIAVENTYSQKVYFFTEVSEKCRKNAKGGF